MLFTEPAFLFLFLPVLLAAYFASPERYRNFILTIGSFAFYAVGEWAFVPWLLVSIAVNYFVAIGLDRWKGTRAAKPLLAFGIVSDLALLLVFKYAGFFTQNLNVALAKLHVAPLPVPSVPLPLGISFFTFHKISYKVDVYRGHAEVRRDPIDLLLYILLFPQLIAGPIIRYHDIAAELVRRTISRSEFAAGLRRFAVGMAKKMLVANTVAAVADRIFATPSDGVTCGVAWLGVICYTLHIYFDFSGYSDMAIGLGRMFGFHILENFDYPYIASSITEFWRRWHISLSRWFRDYLYIPLGGNRGSPGRTYLNLVTIFFLCGLWHGASWTFVVWGLFHGALLVVERLGLSRLLGAWPLAVRHAYTLLMVMVGWVLFRAETLGQAGSLLKAMAGFSGAGHGVPLQSYLDGMLVAAMVCGAIGATPILPALSRLLSSQRAATGRARALAAVGTLASDMAVVVMLLASALQVAAGTYNPFIYFRF
jgi:alginate O-acetyltransferase complex protein AlgI